VSHIPVAHLATSSSAMAAVADQARLGDPARLGRDEPDRAQGRRKIGFPRTKIGAYGGARRGRRDPAGDAAKGLHRGCVQRFRQHYPVVK